MLALYRIVKGTIDEKRGEIVDDYKRVVVVTLVDQMEEANQTISDIEKQVRHLGDSTGAHDDTTEIRRDRQDRRFDDYLS